MEKELEQDGYIVLKDKEIMCVVGKPAVGKTTFLAKQAHFASKEHKVLYFSLESSKENLLKRFNKMSLNNENITIIDSLGIKVEDIENYIDENTDYIYIDYLLLLGCNKKFVDKNDEMEYILGKLRSYVEKYNVKVLAITVAHRSSKPTEKEIFASDTYKSIDCVWELLEDSMIRIK